MDGVGAVHGELMAQIAFRKLDRRAGRSGQRRQRRFAGRERGRERLRKLHSRCQGVWRKVDDGIDRQRRFEFDLLTPQHFQVAIYGGSPR